MIKKLIKTYLVGGAVRDQLLNEPFHERDWVVVGGTAEDLLKQGYRQVGRDFPVFLHPKTQEEYALARTERKAGKGYHGFVCDANASVTLEEDLSRRDLTINAMAMDAQDDTHVIDPYGGLRDLELKQLRHVSPAFVEDPVRVLRVARFAARYHRLGFVVADETQVLMQQMVQQGELDYLVPERVWQAWQTSLCEANPEVFIQVLQACGAGALILPELEGVDLKILMTARQLFDDPETRFAALMHVLTPEQIEAVCVRLRVPKVYTQLAMLSAQFCNTILRISQLDAEAIVTALEQLDVFRRYARFEALLRVCEARTMTDGVQNLGFITRWKRVFEVCDAINPRTLVDEGYQGEQIKHKLHARRVEAAMRLMKSW